LKLVYKIKGPDKIALITDAMRGAGMPPGPSVLGGNKNGQQVIIEDGVAKLPDRSAFAGSVATADLLVRNMVRMAGIPLPEAVQMMTASPARIMGIASQKGTLEKGKDADLVIFNEDIEVSRTIVGGRTVFTAGI
jgi:N-acetylglucosamine-6-phosphate deacetylase